MANPVSATQQYQFLAKVPDQVGYLVIGEDGAVILSSGDLQNNDRFAGLIYKMVYLSKGSAVCNEGMRRLTVNYEKHSYVVTLSNKKIYVVKRRPHSPSSNIV